MIVNDRSLKKALFLLFLKFFVTIFYIFIYRDENTFFNKGEDQKMLFDLILAGNYLDIKGIMDIGCKIVAKQIQTCKDAEAIRQKFNIKNDFPAEEETEATTS